MVNTSTGRPPAAHQRKFCTKGSVSEGCAGIKDFIVGLMMTLPMHSRPLVVNAASLPARHRGAQHPALSLPDYKASGFTRKHSLA